MSPVLPVLYQILETTNPSDVTEVVGSGKADLGLKAMIHILAAKDKGIDLKSFGTLLDEPPTGLVRCRICAKLPTQFDRFSLRFSRRA